MSLRMVLLFTAILFAGLNAGLFFGWLVSVIRGTGKVGDSAYVSTMQSINREIVNPWFVISFMATPFLLAAASIAEFRLANSQRGWSLAAASATYAVGVLGVTVGGNIPLNNALDRVELEGIQPAQLRDARTAYEGPWNRWHNLRTAASILAFAIATTAALLAETGDG